MGEKYNGHLATFVEMKRVMAIAVLAIGLPGVGSPCDCDPRFTIADHYNSAEYVFHARVQSVRVTFVPAHLSGHLWLGRRAGGPPAFVVTAAIEPLSEIKGSSSELAAVYTHQNEGTCGVRIEQDAEYLFFADDSGAVHLCKGTIARSSSRWSEVFLEVLRQKAVESVEAERSTQ